MRAFLMVLTFAALVCTGGITSAAPITYQFSGVRFTFPDGVAVAEGTFALDLSTGEFSSVDFFLSSPDPFASGHYVLACCGGPTGLSFIAEPINTRLTLQFLDRLSESPDRIVSAVLDLTLLGQPTYTASMITGALVPVDEPSTFWLVLVALCVTVGFSLRLWPVWRRPLARPGLKGHRRAEGGFGRAPISPSGGLRAGELGMR